MIEILGKKYYINVDNVIEECRPPQIPKKPRKTTKTSPPISEESYSILELNVFKFELFKSCIERALSEFPTDDQKEDISIFAERDTSISFKIAFNTLIKYNILIEEE